MIPPGGLRYGSWRDWQLTERENMHWRRVRQWLCSLFKR
jgi:hypothetical protein